jgi:putative endonuclease
VPGDRAGLGRLGEQLAAREVARRGGRILARRLKTRHAELDLVAVLEGRLLALEVKTSAFPRDRRGPWRPADRHSPRAAARQRAALEEVRARLSWSGPCALALAEVWIGASGRAIRLRILERLEPRATVNRGGSAGR